MFAALKTELKITNRAHLGNAFFQNKMAAANSRGSSVEILHSTPLSDEDVKRELQVFLKKTHVIEGLPCDHLAKLKQLHSQLASSSNIENSRN